MLMQSPDCLGHPPHMSRRGDHLLVAGEIGWLLVSTTLLIVLAVKEPGEWRAVWLAMLIVNAAVVGYRVKRTSRQLRAGRSRA
jgi:hypothetical protein